MPNMLALASLALACFFAAPTPTLAADCTPECETEFITGCMPFQCGQDMTTTTAEAHAKCSADDNQGKCVIGCTQTDKMLACEYSACKDAASWTAGACASAKRAFNWSDTAAWNRTGQFSKNI